MPDELKNSRKKLINNKNNDNNCFSWCHVRHLNLVARNLQRIAKGDKEIVSKLNYEGICFPVSKKIIVKLKSKIVFCYHSKLADPVYLSNQKFGSFIDLLLISDE